VILALHASAGVVAGFCVIILSVACIVTFASDATIASACASPTYQRAVTRAYSIVAGLAQCAAMPDTAARLRARIAACTEPVGDYEHALRDTALAGMAGVFAYAFTFRAVMAWRRARPRPRMRLALFGPPYAFTRFDATVHRGRRTCCG